MALMPIGPMHEGENTASHCHVDAPEAITAFIELGADCFVPMHYGTFAWGSDHTYFPIKCLPACWNEHQEELGNKQLLFAQCGKEYGITKS